ncbi:hypothetical protein CAP35_11175 [Chitinophagaceae bacterium IBVUCB1]|nr:hypothetical protein CAP35_11175 [Chitinophagaceae bacterium IBVUCB1]
MYSTNCKFLRLTVFILCILISHLAFAQGRGYFDNTPDRKFYGGVVGGLNFSALRGDNYTGYRKAGLNVGGTVFVRLMPKLFTSIELIYTQKGCRGIRVFESYYTGTFIEKYIVNLNYFELPIMLHYQLNDKWNAGFGAAYAGLVNYKEEVFTDQPFVFTADKYAFNNDEISFIINANMQFYKGWFLGMRYQQSLATIREQQNIPFQFSNGSASQLNQLFSLRLIYLID